jgi:hypothetical protein
MTNWNTLDVTLTYTAVLDEIAARDDDAAKLFNPLTTTVSNLPQNTVRWNPSNARFEILSGSSWNALTTSYAMNVTQLGGQNAAYYLNWNNFTNKPTTYPPSSHTHDDRYYTEAESDGRFGATLANSGQLLQLKAPNGGVVGSITVAYAASAGSAENIDGGTY